MGGNFGRIAIPVAMIAAGVATGGAAFAAEGAAAGAASGAAASGAAASTAASSAGLWSAIGTGAQIAGAGIGAVGALKSAAAEKTADEYNAGIASNNEKIAGENAKFAGLAGEQQAAMSEMKTRAQVGAIKTAQAAGGVDVNSGSAVDVRSSAASLGELDAITIRSNAARAAYGYQNQGINYSAEANLENSKAGSAEESGIIGASTSILGGVGSAASNYGKFLQQGSLNSNGVL